jgi:hypothetical protein
MLALFGIGVGLWLMYGILLGAAPVIAANALTGVQVRVLVACASRDPFMAHWAAPTSPHPTPCRPRPGP